MKEIQVNGNKVRLTEAGLIRTVIKDGQVNNHSRLDKLVDEFYPFVGDTVQTQVNNILVQPNTFRKRTFNYRDEDFLKREIGKKNRSAYSVSEDFNCQESTIRSYINKHDIDKPLENEELLQGLWEEHGSVSKIANITNSEIYEVKIALEQKGVISPYD
jgi:hypothetical protein